ncbi:uncharacterized protein Z518_03359 [Rhinocladiella mackenziei CBS 650.93]|uniref:Azaphilone pigments biosynthesis cluster protein L N-terminal domain-containing protein n=1 Tax=Rhinocladiella mackenziei CBS 650.93 TaxID=1442369 RepID=A0A0D2G2D9_9EURO|nr:uncharacterized protein Z518_03359 [Rhinocladiella mackenziei CBS 650.93]KIX08702.1 hypothetical protein Z518_03359 [Rhinocladiella mackenziei CBS 650.93]
MSGLEILGITASIVQVADLGARVSVNLFTFSRTVRGAQKSIQGISEEIAVTSTVLSQLGNELKRMFQGSQNHSQEYHDCCQDIFKQLEHAINTNDQESGASATLTDLKKRLKFTFMEPHIDSLQSKLERFKSSLLVMLNLLIFAGQVRRFVMPSHESLRLLKEQNALLQGLASSDAASLLRERAQEQPSENSKAEAQKCPISTMTSTTKLNRYTSKPPIYAKLL